MSHVGNLKSATTIKWITNVDHEKTAQSYKYDTLRVFEKKYKK